MTGTAPSSPAAASRVTLGAVLVTALVAWIAAAAQMRGMDAGPGTDLGAFGWFIGIWVTMMAAMMLPSAAPTVQLVARLGRAAHAAQFVAGYLLAWTACGAAAYAADRAAAWRVPSFVAWDARGSWVAGGALVAAGVYQLTPLKTACLRHCRSPLAFLVRRRRGPLGVVQAGFGHGGYCAGCCAGLMLALFALGVMSLVWMGAVAAAVLVEKVLPRGESLARVLAVALTAFGVWVAVAPGSVPGLTEPGPAPMGQGMSG